MTPTPPEMIATAEAINGVGWDKIAALIVTQFGTIAGGARWLIGRFETIRRDDKIEAKEREIAFEKRFSELMSRTFELQERMLTSQGQTNRAITDLVTAVRHSLMPMYAAMLFQQHSGKQMSEDEFKKQMAFFRDQFREQTEKHL